MERFVYVLELTNGQYYVGSTNDIERRLSDHLRGNTPTTKRIPVKKLLFKRIYEQKDEARRTEMFLKKQKNRDVIKKFMTNDWHDL